jgi:predicted HTH transcriptional regulator
LELLRDKSKLTILEISIRSVDKHIRTLKEAGRLEKKGAKRNGWWEVKEESSEKGSV